MAQESIAHKTARTTFWGAIEQVSTLSVQFIITMILARLLSPSDYGIIAILTIFIAISQQFVECGISNALIRKQDCTQTDYSTAFFFNVGVSCIVYVILFFIAPLIATFFKMDILSIVLRCYGLSIIFQSFRIVQYAILCKRLEFKKMAKVTALVTMMSGILGIVFAYLGYGVWALVVQSVFLALSTSIAYFFVLRWIPSFVFSLESFQYLWNFGSKMLLSGIISVTYTNLYSMVIGKIYDSKLLGLFNRSHQLANIYPNIVQKVFVRNSLPILSEIQDDQERLIKVYREFITIVSFLTFPVVLLLFVIAKPFILFFLTDKWEGAIIYLQVFCLSSLLMPANWINLNLLQVLGRSDLTLRAEIIKKLIGVVLIFSMVSFGPLILAISYSLYDIVVYCINLYYAKKLIGLSYLSQLKDMWPCLWASFMSSFIAFLCMMLFETYFLKIVVAMFAGLLTYIVITKKVQKLDIYLKFQNLIKI